MAEPIMLEFCSRWWAAVCEISKQSPFDVERADTRAFCELCDCGDSWLLVSRVIYGFQQVSGSLPLLSSSNPVQGSNFPDVSPRLQWRSCPLENRPTQIYIGYLPHRCSIWGGGGGRGEESCHNPINRIPAYLLNTNEELPLHSPLYPVPPLRVEILLSLTNPLAPSQASHSSPSKPSS